MLFLSKVSNFSISRGGADGIAYFDQNISPLVTDVYRHNLVKVCSNVVTFNSGTHMLNLQVVPNRQLGLAR